MPSARRGCAETLEDPYYSRVPLPKIPGYRALDKQARVADVTDDVANNTWHSRLTYLTRQLASMEIGLGTTNYYTRLRKLHNPYR